MSCQRCDELASALQLMLGVTNGPPLADQIDEWCRAMNVAHVALGYSHRVRRIGKSYEIEWFTVNESRG